MNLKNLILPIVLRQFRTTRDIMRFSFRFFGSRIALHDRRGQFTYQQLEQRVLRLSAAMEAHGVKKGEIVFTWLPETGEQLEARLATFDNGTVLAMFHQFLPPETALEMLRQLKPKLFIHDPLLSQPMLAQAKHEFPELLTLAIGDEYEQWLAAQSPRKSKVKLLPEDYASLHLTSGTTGQPKAIGVTHGKYIRQMQMMAGELSKSESRKNDLPDVIMLGIPLTGPGGGLVLPMLLSASALVIPSDYSVATLARLIAEKHVTKVFLSPSGLMDLMDDPNLDNYDMSSLRSIIYGSEMMPAAKLTEALRRYGPIFQQGYGSFEAMPPLAWMRPAEHFDESGQPASLERLSAVGKTAPGIEIEVLDAQRQRLPKGEIGLITVKTPLAFSGYWNRPDLDDATLLDGWVMTGDMGYFDKNDYLHVLGRKADTVRRGQQEIYPRQVEEVAHCHAAVRDACLVQAGDEAHLVVTLRHTWQDKMPHEALINDIRDFLKQNLNETLQPDRIHIFDSIPRSFLNKMLRREVRDALSASMTAR